MARGKLYLHVYNELKLQIEKGTLKPGTLIDSERALIDRFKVSRVTLRKALGMLVKDQYLHCKPSIGYEVKPFQKDKDKNSESALIGIIFNDASSTDGMRFLQDFEHIAATLGFSFLIGFNQYRISLENDCILRFQQHNIKGLVLSPAVNGNLKPIATQLIEENFPMVFLGDAEHWQKDYSSLTHKMHLITDDSAQAVSLCLNHLSLTRHKNILFVGSQTMPFDSIRKREFIEQYKSVKSNSESYTIDFNCTSFSDSDVSSFITLIKKLKITAIICYNDQVTKTMTKILQSNFTDIKNKLSIINIGKTSCASNDFIEVMSVESSNTLWGEQILHSLKAQIDGQAFAKRIKIPFSLHYNRLVMN